MSTTPSEDVYSRLRPPTHRARDGADNTRGVIRFVAGLEGGALQLGHVRTGGAGGGRVGSAADLRGARCRCGFVQGLCDV